MFFTRLHVFCVCVLQPLCSALLDGIPQSTVPTNTAPNLDTIHQIIQTETLIRMEMQKQMATLQTTITNLRTTQESLQQKITDMQATHQREINSLTSMCSASCQNASLSLYSNMFAKKQPSITFYVSLNSQLDDAPSTTTIKFDKVMANIGNAYNSQTGVFTAPVSGTYELSLTVISATGSARGNIRVNGNAVLHVFADNTQYVTGWGRGSSSIALHLNAGDEVYVTEPDGGHQTIIAVAAGTIPVTTFSGHLIQAD